jgi:Enoyl-(Acyl carrier protein) reductase
LICLTHPRTRTFAREGAGAALSYLEAEEADADETVGLVEAEGRKAVAPGPIWTPLIPATMPTEKAQGHGESTPLGRAGQPAEVAPTYVFFASQESSYITAEMLAVTGGQPVT